MEYTLIILLMSIKFFLDSTINSWVDKGSTEGLFNTLSKIQFLPTAKDHSKTISCEGSHVALGNLLRKTASLSYVGKICG